VVSPRRRSLPAPEGALVAAWSSRLPKGPPRPMATCHRGSDPREVLLHFRGLRPVDVSPYWLGDPDSRFVASDKSSAAPFGFPPTYPLLRRSSAAPLLWLRPLQGSTRSARRRRRSRAKPVPIGYSHGVCLPYDASARASPLHLGLPHRVRSAHRVSHPLDGFLLARTSGHISDR
jgi:hypothetical protein